MQPKRTPHLRQLIANSETPTLGHSRPALLRPALARFHQSPRKQKSGQSAFRNSSGSLAMLAAVLWRALRAEIKIRDSGGLETLLQICKAADRAAECATRIAKDGAVIDTKHGPKDHPLLKHELANRAYVTRTLTRLGWIVTEKPKRVGRPGSGGIGITYDQIEELGLVERRLRPWETD